LSIFGSLADLVILKGFIFYASLAVLVNIGLLNYSNIFLKKNPRNIKKILLLILEVGLSRVIGFLCFKIVKETNFEAILHYLEMLFAVLIFTIITITRSYSRRFLLGYFYFHVFALTLIVVSLIGALASSQNINDNYFHIFNLADLKIVQVSLLIGLLTLTGIPPFLYWFLRAFNLIHSRHVIIVNLVLPVISTILMYKFINNNAILKYIGLFSFFYSSFYAVFSTKPFRIISYLSLSFLSTILIGMNFLDGIIPFGFFVFTNLVALGLLVVVYDRIGKEAAISSSPNAIYEILINSPRDSYILGAIILFLTPTLAFMSPTNSFFTFKELIYALELPLYVRFACYVFLTIRGIAFAKLLYPFLKVFFIRNINFNTLEPTERHFLYLPLLILAILIFVLEIFLGTYLFYVRDIFWITNIFGDKFTFNSAFFTICFGVFGYYLVNKKVNIFIPDAFLLFNKQVRVLMIALQNAKIKLPCANPIVLRKFFTQAPHYSLVCLVIFSLLLAFMFYFFL
jgi:hypothetical protein